MHRSSTIAVLTMLLLLIGSGLLIHRGFESGSTREQVARDFLETWPDTLETLAPVNGDGRPILVLRLRRAAAGHDDAFGHPLLREAMTDHFRTVCLREDDAGPAIVMHGPDGEAMAGLTCTTTSASSLSKLMVAALEHVGQSPPAYLRLVRAECAAGERRHAVFRAVCAWDGAAALGQIDGVLGVQSGRSERGAMVEITFDPDVITHAELVTRAEAVGCSGSEMQVLSDAPGLDENPDPYVWLSHTDLRHLPLTPMQAMRINASLRDRKDPRVWLSPLQIALLDEIELTLTHDRRSLNGLEWPREAAELDLYTVTLRERLDGAAARRSASVE